MKMLYVVHQFFPYFYSGTELLTRNLATYIKKLGHSSAVLSYIPNSNRDGVKKERVDNLDVYFARVQQESPLRDVSLHNKDVYEQIRLLIKDMRPDIIHFTHLRRLAEVVFVAKKMRIPYIITLTDPWIICPKAIFLRNKVEPCPGPENGEACSKHCFGKLNYDFSKRLSVMKKILKNASYITYSSEALAKAVRENGLVEDRSNFLKIKHGYNPEKILKKKRKKFVFAYTGSLHPYKGAHVCVRAFTKLKNRSANLFIYGDKKHDSIYSRYLTKLAGKDKRIIFKGVYKQEETSKLMASVDCVVVSSIWQETHPFTAVAAVAYKTPVLGSKTGGIPEIVKDGQTGFLFKPGDSNDLSKKMKKIMQKEIYKKMVKKCYYNQRIETEAFEYSQLYESVYYKI